MLGTAAVLGAAAVLTVTLRGPQPAFEGKSAEYWARQLATGDSKARLAFRKMGPAAVPALINAVRKKDSASQRILIWAYPKAPAVLRRCLPDPFLAQTIGEGAVAALYELGASAAPAVPVLIEANLDADFSNFTYTGLAHATLLNIGEAGVSQFINVLRRGKSKSRAKAAMHLGLIGPPAGPAALALARALNDPDTAVRNEAVTALAQIGPSASAALPALKGTLKLDNDYFRLRVVEALWKVDRDSASTVPVLIKVLRDPQNPNRAKAATLLGEMGPHARAALPVLTEILREEFSYTRVKAEEALRKIDLAVAGGVKR